MISTFYPIVGGVTRYTHELAKRLMKKGYEIWVVTGHGENNGIRNCGQVPVFDVRCMKSIYESVFINPLDSHWTLLKFLKEKKFDLIHIQHFGFSMLLFLLKHVNIPVISSTHLEPERYLHVNKIVNTLWKSVAINMWAKYILERSRYIIAVGEFYRKTLMEIGLYDPEKVIYVPNGVDSKKFSPGDSEFKSKLGTKYILFVGRLDVVKGLKYLIAAFKLVESKFPEVKLVIVGDGPEKERLRRMASENVIFTGKVLGDKLIDIFRGAEMFILPSVAEGSPLAVLEAMSCGIPVVSTAVGEIPHILSEGKGLLVKPCSVNELANAISFLLENEDIRKKMSIKSREYIRNNRDWKNIIGRIERVYHKVLECQGDNFHY